VAPFARTNGAFVGRLPGGRGGGLTLGKRFQRQDYAKIDIVQTEKKGFGLRAAEDMIKCVNGMFLSGEGSDAHDVGEITGMLSFTNTWATSFRILLLSSGCGNMGRRASSISIL
jgi:hypothetical protein